MKGINPKLKLYCPVWYSRIRRTKAEKINSLRNFDTTNSDGTSIRSGSFCVVGELYDWTVEYRDRTDKYCGECFNLAFHLMNDAYSPETVMEFQSDINQLITHIEKDHPEIVERVGGSVNVDRRK